MRIQIYFIFSVTNHIVWRLIIYTQNNTLMKKNLFTLILSSISLFSFTQNQYISGTIVDSGTQEAMPFCKLTLKQDTVVSAFAVSDMNGYFELPATYGNYDLSIKFIGYTTDSMAIEVRNKNIFLGNINLEQNSSTLNTVEVKGSIRDVNIDKNEYIITDEMRAGTSKAIDLLDKVEGVSYNKYNKTIKVDNEQNVLLLVNGLQKSESFIKNINPKQIAKVEVIRDPSGQYGLEGYTSVINIKLKKNYVGQELMVSTETIFDPKTKITENLVPISGLGLDYNFTRKSLNIYSQFWANNSNLNLKQKLVKTYNTGYKTTQFDENDADNLTIQEFSTGGVFGADYQINPKHLISIEGGYNLSPNSILNERSIIKNELDSTLLFTQNLHSQRHTCTKSYNASAFYIGTFTKDKELRVTYKNNGSFSNTNSELRVDNLLFENQVESDNYMNSLNLNWSHTLTKKVSYQLGAGSNLGNKTIENIKSVSNILSQFEQSEFRNNVFGYATWKISSKLSLKGGLAVENSITTSTEQNQNFWIYRPHFDLLYKPSKKINFRLKYRVNSDYPTLDQLNPKEIYLDNFSVQKGNPGLSPSTIHNYSIKASAMQGYLSAEFYVKNSENYIAPISKLRTDGIFETNFENIGGFIQKGVKANLTVPFGNSLFWQTSVNIFNAEFNYENNANNFTDWSGESQLIYVSEKHGYFAGVLMEKSNIKRINPQGYTQNANDFWAFLIQKSLFKDKGSIMLLYMMPINFGVDYTFDNSIETQQYSQVSTTDFNIIKHVIMLEMNYRFQSGKDIKKVDRKESKGFF